MANRLILVSGARGTGKTTLSGTYLPPSQVGQTYFHDSERSANNLNEQLKASGLAFGRYVDLQDRFSHLPGDQDLLDRIQVGKLPWVTGDQQSALADYYRYIVQDLDANLTPGKYRLYVHDTIERLEAGMAAWVESHRKETGWTTRAYGRLWTEGYYPLYQGFLSAIFARGVETIIFTSHLRTPWSQGNEPKPITGKVEPAGKAMLYFLSQLVLWLVHEPTNADGAPAGLVLKERMGTVNVAADDWDIARRLPRRIPHCTWKDIRRYQASGCDLAHPAPGEVPSAVEEDLMSEFLTDAQMRLMILEAEKDLAEAKGGNILQGDGKFDGMPVMVSSGPQDALGSPQSVQSPAPDVVLTDEQKDVLQAILASMDGEIGAAAFAQRVSAELQVPLPIAFKIVKYVG